MRAAMHNAGFKHCHTLDFPQPLYPSGWWTATMASNTAITEGRIQDIQSKKFETLYFNEMKHRAAMQPLQYLVQQLGE
jgi:spermidine synthase